MKNLEKKLNSFKRCRLPLRADMRIRLALHARIWRKRFSQPGLLVRPVVLGLVLILMLAVFVPGYAYASGTVTAGHILYPIKKKIESVELALAAKPKEKAEKLEKFSERRIEEAEVIAQKKEVDAANLKKTIDEAVHLHKEALAKTASSAPAAAQVQNGKKDENALSNKNEERLKNIAHRVGIRASDELVDSISEAIENFRETKGKTRLNREKSPASFWLRSTSGPEFTEEDAGDDSGAGHKTEKDIGRGDDNKKNEDGQSRAVERGSATSSKRSDYILEVKTKIEDLKNNIKEDDYEPEDVESLFKRLKNRAEKIDKATSTERAERLFRSTRNFSNNAREFLRKRDMENDKDTGNGRRPNR